MDIPGKGVVVIPDPILCLDQAPRASRFQWRYVVRSRLKPLLQGQARPGRSGFSREEDQLDTFPGPADAGIYIVIRYKI